MIILQIPQKEEHMDMYLLKSCITLIPYNLVTCNDKIHTTMKSLSSLKINLDMKIFLRSEFDLNDSIVNLILYM